MLGWMWFDGKDYWVRGDEMKGLGQSRVETETERLSRELRHIQDVVGWGDYGYKDAPKTGLVGRLSDLERVVGHPETSELKATGLVADAVEFNRRSRLWYTTACDLTERIDRLSAWLWVVGIGWAISVVTMVLVSLHR